MEPNNFTLTDTGTAAFSLDSAATLNSATGLTNSRSTASNMPSSSLNTTAEVPEEQSQKSLSIPDNLYEDQHKIVASKTSQERAPAFTEEEVVKIRALINTQATASQSQLPFLNAGEEVSGLQPQGVFGSEQPPAFPSVYALSNQELVKARTSSSSQSTPTMLTPPTQTCSPFDVSIHSTTGPLQPEHGGQKWYAVNDPENSKDWEERKKILYHFYAYNYFDTLPDISPDEPFQFPSATSLPPPQTPTLDLLNLKDADLEFLHRTQNMLSHLQPSTHHKLAEYLISTSNTLSTAAAPSRTRNPITNNDTNAPSTHRQALLFKIRKYNNEKYPRDRLYMRGLTDADIHFLETLNAACRSGVRMQIPKHATNQPRLGGPIETIVSGVSDVLERAARDTEEVGLNLKITQAWRETSDARS